MPQTYNLGDGVLDIGVGLGKLQEQLNQAHNRVKASLDKIGNIGRHMSVAITAPIAAIGTGAVYAFAKFDDAMRNVNVIARESEENLEAMRKEVLRLAVEFGRTPTDLAMGLYHINSASRKGAEGVEVLRAATMASRAGISDVATAARALTNVLNAYGMKTSEVNDVADVMFKTVERGVLYFRDLAEYIGGVTATAAIAKVPFAEVAAAMATMTRAGIDAAESATALNRMIYALARPNEDLQKVLKQTEEGTGSAMLANRGLGGTLMWLVDQADNSMEGFNELIPVIRGVKAAFSLARMDGSEFAKDLELIAQKANRTGANQAALGEQMRGLGFAIDRAKSSILVTAIAIGETLAPSVRKLTNFINSTTAAFNGMSAGAKRLTLKTVALVATIGPLLAFAGVLGKVWYGYKRLKMAGKIFGKEMLVKAAPFLAAAAAVAAIATAVAVAIGEGDTFTERFKSGMGKIRAAAMKAVGYLIGLWRKWGHDIVTVLNMMLIAAKYVFSAVASVVGTVAYDIFEMLKHPFETMKFVFDWFIQMNRNLWDAVFQIGSNIMSNLWEYLKTVWARMGARVDWFAGVFKSGFSIISTNVHMVGNAIYNFFSGVFGYVADLFKSIWQTVKNVFTNFVTVVKNAGSNISDYMSAIWKKITHPTEPFEPPDMTNLMTGVVDAFESLPTLDTDDLFKIDSDLSKQLDGEIADFRKALDEPIPPIPMPDMTPILQDVENVFKNLPKLEDYGVFTVNPMDELKKIKQKMEDTLSAYARSREADAHRARAEDKKTSDAMVDNAKAVEHARRLANAEWFGAEELVKKAQESTRTILERVVKAKLDMGGERTPKYGDVTEVIGTLEDGQTTAELQREKMIDLLGNALKPSGGPIFY